MFNFFSKIFFIVGTFTLLAQSAQAGNTVPINDGTCNPRGILDYSSLGISVGTVCQILPITPNTPDAYPTQPPLNTFGPTQEIEFARSGNFSYKFSCQGFSVPPDQVNFAVTVPASCNSTGTYTISASPNPVQVCSPATQGTTNVSWGIPSGKTGGVKVSGNTSWFVPPSATGNSSQSAPWLQFGQSYVFTIFDTTGGIEVSQTSVTVNTNANNCPGTGGTGYCGDNTVQNPNTQGGNEQCDLGAQNGVIGSTCSATCQTVTPPGSACGNGVQETGEQCDFGSQNGQSGSTCSASCQTVIPAGGSCGDGAIDPGEQCGEPGLSCGANSTCNTSMCTCQPSLPQNLYYRCPVQNSGQNCATTVNQPCNGAPNCFSLSSNPNAETQCAQYCGSQSPRYTCGGSDCIPCGVSGQPACPSGPFTFTNLFQCQSSLVCQDNPSCSFVASPSFGTVGSSVNLTLSSSPDSISCQYNINPNQSASSGVSGTSYSGPSGSLRLGNNTFNATCNYPGVGQISCISNTVAGTAAQVCGNGIIQSPETCDDGNTVSGDGCSATCQTEVSTNTYACINGACSTACGGGGQPACTSGSAASCQVSCTPTLGSRCDGLVIPSRITTGMSFVVIPSFTNTGTAPWITGFSTISSGSFGTIVKTLGSTINNQGVFSPSYNFTAPSSPGSYALQFRMRDATNASFGDTCGVNGNWVPVVLPACSDNEDNDNDGIIDFVNNDPGCDSGGDDTEEDPVPGAVLKISANPQLVRKGGSSYVSYEVGNCTKVNATGVVVPGTWELKQDGRSIGSRTGITGTGDSRGTQIHPVNNIQIKTTFTLSCEGTTRSATIAVIKINEV